MTGEKYRRLNFKLGLSIFWILFTSTLVFWWWVHGGIIEGNRMLFWEGLVLVPLVFVGGVALCWFTFRDVVRHQQMRLFFSNFSHDLKTSITRLRLQSEILQEDKEIANNENLQKLLKDLSHLDLQLDNSLFFAKSDLQTVFAEKTRLSEMVGSARGDWPELEVSLERDAVIHVDRQIFKSILRNLFQNARQHARATQVKLSVKKLQEGKLLIDVSDNGASDRPAPMYVGQVILSSHEGGNGMGLYLSRVMLEKMQGSLRVEHSPRFSVQMQVKGELI